MPYPVLVAAAAGGLAYALLKGEKSHDQIVEEVYENLRYEAPSSANLYVDHGPRRHPKPTDSTRGPQPRPRAGHRLQIDGDEQPHHRGRDRGHA